MPFEFVAPEILLGIGGAAAGALAAAADHLRLIPESVKKTAGDVIDYAGRLITSGTTGFVNKALKTAGNVINIIKDLTTEKTETSLFDVDRIENYLGQLEDTWVGKANQHLDDIKQGTELDIEDIIQKALKDAQEKVHQTLRINLQSVRDITDSVRAWYNGIASYCSSVLNSTQKLIEEVREQCFKGIENAVTEVRQALEGEVIGSLLGFVLLCNTLKELFTMNPEDIAELYMKTVPLIAAQASQSPFIDPTFLKGICEEKEE